MKDILSEIVEHKRREISAMKSGYTVPERKCLSLKEAIAGAGSGIIAEFKRKSPSKGWIHKDANPLEVIPGYAKAGASALSILTDVEFFGGSIDYIRAVRGLVDIPILRKDFIIDERQVGEAREAGADAVLLIAACLGIEECRDLIAAAHSYGLEVLLEIHSEAELAYAGLGADLVGVNNRNLGSFITDVENSFRLATLLQCPVLVSESGISNPETVLRLRKAGYSGFLMGENFMKHSNPPQALAEFVKAITA